MSDSRFASYEGVRLWCIRDREPQWKTHPKLPTRIKTKAGARKLAKRMNVDWERYRARA